MLILGYARSPFRDFESYLRLVVGLDDDDIWLILKQNKSISVTYDLSPGIYKIKDNSEAAYKMRDQKETQKLNIMI